MLQILHSIKDIDPIDWASIQDPNFPFSSYGFLLAMEESQSLGKRTGWFPLFITLRENDKLSGAMYLYLKTNSHGEYIFDWAWADAWQKNGLSYYPKLTAAIPFTPATGPKILVADSEQKTTISKRLIQEALKFCQTENIQTAHFLFIPKSEVELFSRENLSIRHTYQYHWHNNNYDCFDDFLMALKQKKRKEIRRERKLLDKSVIIHEVTGSAVGEYADLMYEFYLSTIDKKFSHDYLTPEFFKMIFKDCQENILLYLAEKDGEFIAGTLNFKKGKTLFGRYWGSTEEIPNLHFELCYYKPIEYAIKHKMTLFEAGAQGEHKVQRGFIPSITYSAHYLPDHELGDAVRNFITREAEQLSHFIEKGPGMVYK